MAEYIIIMNVAGPAAKGWRGRHQWGLAVFAVLGQIAALSDCILL